MEHLVDNRRVDGIDRRGHVERHARFPALDKPDGLAHAAAQRIVDHQGRIFAQPDRGIAPVLEMVPGKRADDQLATADAGRHGLAESDPSDDQSQAHD